MNPQIAAQVAGAAVKTANGESISTGIWTLVGIVASGVLAAIAAWMRFGPVWKKTEQDGDTQLRSEMWKDIEALKQAKENQSRRLTVAETKLSEQASQIGQLRFLVALLNTELERVSPGNPIAVQVRVVMEQLQMQASSSHANDVGEMAETMSKLCKEIGVGEDSAA